MKYLIYIFLLFSLAGYGQSKMLLASIQQAGVDYFQGDNAADPISEVDGTANTNGNSQFTVSSQTTVDSQTPTDGSYFLMFQSNASGTREGFITLPGVSNGDNVTITLDANEITGLAFAIRLFDAQGWTADVNNGFSTTGDVWTEYSLTGTADQDDPVISIRTTSGGTSGDQLGIDNIRVVKN